MPDNWSPKRARQRRHKNLYFSQPAGSLTIIRNKIRRQQGYSIHSDSRAGFREIPSRSFVSSAGSASLIRPRVSGHSRASPDAFSVSIPLSPFYTALSRFPSSIAIFQWDRRSVGGGGQGPREAKRGRGSRVIVICFRDESPPPRLSTA